MSDANARRWSTALAALDANLLVALDALLEESSVTRAAGRVGITQSAMSQTLSRLRKQFDDPILVKVGRHMEPSPFGRRIRGRLRRAILELEAVVADRPDFDPATSSRRFVVAAVDYLAMVFAPLLQRRLAEKAPGSRLAVHGLDAGSIATRLAEGVVHMYIGVAGDTERGLDKERLYLESLCVVRAADHPHGPAPLDAETYAELPHVHVSPRREPGSRVERALAAEGLSRDVAVEVPYFGLVPGLLEGSALVATLPRSVAEHLAARHPLQLEAPPVPMAPFEVCMAWHPTFEGDPAIRWLADQVRAIGEAVGAEST